MRKGITFALAVAALLIRIACRAGTVNYFVDGDTVDGIRLRVQGIDTPEQGQSDHAAANARAQNLDGGRSVAVINGAGDRYDRCRREIGYLTFERQDLGAIPTAENLATTRYDSLNGYGWLRRHDDYRALYKVAPQLLGAW